MEGEEDLNQRQGIERVSVQSGLESRQCRCRKQRKAH